YSLAWPRGRKAYILPPATGRICREKLSEDFDLFPVGEYSVIATYGAAKSAGPGRDGQPQGSNALPAALARSQALRFRVIAPVDQDAQAIEWLRSLRRGRSGFSECCFDQQELERFLVEFPGSRYTPYVYLWLGHAVAPGFGPDKKIEAFR